MIKLRKCNTILELIEVRDEAVGHLVDLRKAMNSNSPWIPQVAQAVELQLVDIIEVCNDRIDLIRDRKILGGYREVVQEAFEFLYECTISEDEIPF